MSVGLRSRPPPCRGLLDRVRTRLFPRQREPGPRSARAAAPFLLRPIEGSRRRKDLAYPTRQEARRLFPVSGDLALCGPAGGRAGGVSPAGAASDNHTPLRSEAPHTLQLYHGRSFMPRRIPNDPQIRESLTSRSHELQSDFLFHSLTALDIQTPILQ